MSIKFKVLILILALAIIMINTRAELLEKKSFEIRDISVNDVDIINNQLKVTVESLNNNDVKLSFKITSNNNTSTTYSDIILKPFTAQEFNLPITFTNLKKLEVTPYNIVNNQVVLYSISTVSYDISNLNNKITQITTTTQPQDIIVTVDSGTGGTSSSSISYVYANGRLIETIDNNGNELYYHQDFIGSTTLITDINKNPVSGYKYYPFGKIFSENGNKENKVKFSGKFYDNESSLYYFNARYYDSDSGRFIGVDPLYKSEEGGYVFTSNNPLRYVDPTGQDAIDIEAQEKQMRLAEGETIFSSGILRDPLTRLLTPYYATITPIYYTQGGKNVVSLKIDYHEYENDLLSLSEAKRRSEKGVSKEITLNILLDSKDTKNPVSLFASITTKQGSSNSVKIVDDFTDLPEPVRRITTQFFEGTKTENFDTKERSFFLGVDNLKIRSVVLGLFFGYGEQSSLNGKILEQGFLTDTEGSLSGPRNREFYGSELNSNSISRTYGGSIETPSPLPFQNARFFATGRITKYSNFENIQGGIPKQSDIRAGVRVPF